MKLPKVRKRTIFLAGLLLIPVTSFSYNAYKDWDNAQLIKGLHQDFPQLVVELEQATGLELEQATDCSITTEKFTSGVRTCELSVRYIGIEESKIIEGSVVGSNDFKLLSYSEDKTASRYSYRSKKSCTLYFATASRCFSHIWKDAPGAASVSHNSIENSP